MGEEYILIDRAIARIDQDIARNMNVLGCMTPDEAYLEAIEDVMHVVREGSPRRGSFAARWWR